MHSSTRKPLHTMRAILLAGFIAGLLDILFASIHFYILTGKGPARILQYIASAAFGKARAYSGETSMIVAGLLFHFLIAYAFTAFFFLIFPRLRFLRRSFLLTGILYGLFIWTVMNRIVVPNSRIAPAPFNWSNALVNMGILIIAIGLPLSSMACRHFQKK